MGAGLIKGLGTLSVAELVFFFCSHNFILSLTLIPANPCVSTELCVLVPIVLGVLSNELTRDGTDYSDPVDLLVYTENSLLDACPVGWMCAGCEGCVFINVGLGVGTVMGV